MYSLPNVTFFLLFMDSLPSAFFFFGNNAALRLQLWPPHSFPLPALHSPTPLRLPFDEDHRQAAGVADPRGAFEPQVQRHQTAAEGDVTNLLLPETPTPIKPWRTARRPLSQPSDASSTCSSPASVTPAPKCSSAAVLEEESGVVKSPAISTVYARRETAEAEGRGRRTVPTTSKGKAPALGTASCPPPGKSTGNNNRKTSMAQDTRSISFSAPCHEAKKKRQSSSTPKLPEDFVKKQRAYFADIDAFELPEEEVSETELE